MKKYFLIPLILLGSCIKPEPPPADIIPKDMMTHMLIDIHVAEAKVATLSHFPDSSNAYYQLYKAKVYKKYNVTPEKFQKSFDFYMGNVELMDDIYEEVIDSLGLMEGRGKLE